MAVGSQFAQYINPLLTLLETLGGSAKASEAKAAVAEHLNLSDSVLDDSMESGQSRFANQVSWARFYLARAGHIDSSKRGVWALTEKGRSSKTLPDDQIEYLIQNVLAKWGKRSAESETSAVDESDGPFGDSFGTHRTTLLRILKNLSPSGFERICQRLLREAGFEQVTVTGKSGDGGIDGIGVLELNAFVSFKVLFQCKRYKDSVGTSVVRDFRGAMMGRADKGLILTTGSFTSEARREAVRDGVPPIELVDGEKLVNLFEELELGLTPRTAYDVDDSFFGEYRDDGT